MNFFDRFDKFADDELLLRIPKEPGNNWHENFIVHLAAVLRPKVYVELGLYQCELFNRIIPYSEYLIGIDSAEKAGIYMKKNEKTRFVCTKTDEFADVLKNENVTIDMLFIDADHSEEWVAKDFKNFLPLVADQGLILLHDGYPKNEEFTQPGYCGDGYKAIEKLTKNTQGYEMMTIPVHPGLTLCRKRSKQLPWK